MISQIEASREVSKKLPGLVTFVRAEPIFNWNSRGVPGISGFDFRIFGGLRYTFNKTATSVAMDQLRKQLQKSAVPPPPEQQEKEPEPQNKKEPSSEENSTPENPPKKEPPSSSQIEQQSNDIAKSRESEEPLATTAEKN